jgi:hypothetical protein
MSKKSHGPMPSLSERTNQLELVNTRRRPVAGATRDRVVAPSPSTTVGRAASEGPGWRPSDELLGVKDRVASVHDLVVIGAASFTACVSTGEVQGWLSGRMS